MFQGNKATVMLAFVQDLPLPSQQKPQAAQQQQQQLPAPVAARLAQLAQTVHLQY